MHASLKLIPTVDTQRTPALNEAAINQTQLIRFMRDRENLGLVQKLGGWTRFYPTAMPAVPRALWAWRDNLANDYLAIGCETSVSTPAVGAPLYVYDVDGGVLQPITPQYYVQNTAVDCTTTLGSDIVTITDAGFSAATTGASGNGTTATITYAGTYVFPVGAAVVGQGRGRGGRVPRTPHHPKRLLAHAHAHFGQGRPAALPRRAEQGLGGERAAGRALDGRGDGGDRHGAGAGHGNVGLFQGGH